MGSPRAPILEFWAVKGPKLAQIAKTLSRGLVSQIRPLFRMFSSPEFGLYRVKIGQFGSELVQFLAQKGIMKEIKKSRESALFQRSCLNTKKRFQNVVHLSKSRLRNSDKEV